MSVWLQILLALCGSGVLVGIAALAIRDLRKGGADAQRADRAEQDLATTRKQGEIMAQQRTVRDAADRLSRGDF